MWPVATVLDNTDSRRHRKFHAQRCSKETGKQIPEKKYKSWQGSKQKGPALARG